jgi:hypothetical protein
MEGTAPLTRTQKLAPGPNALSVEIAFPQKQLTDR